MKRILVCLDGTWNESGSEKSDSDTNVAKLYRMASSNSQQVKEYFAGVGTRLFEWLSGGMFGIGLFDQIKDGYQFVVNQYEPGDQVIIVGFSRGAFSARALAGFIATCGVLVGRTLDIADIRDRHAINDLWQLYKEHKNNLDSAPHAEKIRDYCEEQCYPNSTRAVSAVAVWDTVGALGIPWEIFERSRIASHLDKFERKKLQFLDVDLHPNVSKGYHAVALDEQRKPCWPALWSGARTSDGSIQQVWFNGSHSNVGGGFAKTGLSDIALDWMLRRLQTRHGLEIDPDKKISLNPAGVWEAVEQTRMEQKLTKIDSDFINATETRVVPDGSRLHSSAGIRRTGTPGNTAIPSLARFAGTFTVDPIDN